MNKGKKPQDKKEEPQEIESTGTFEFSNNSYYIGGYKILVSGEKIRHGKGKLVTRGINGTNIGEESYEGNWANDKFNGYGEYHYSNGDIYKGEFVDGLFKGNGVYYCADGTKYEGQFSNHKFHGSGIYYDADGILWKGEFREGFFSSKDQARLKEERRITNKISEYEKIPITNFFNLWEETLSKVDKKNAKEQLSPFFADKETLSEYIKDPYPKFEEKPYDKWNEVFKFAFNPSNYKAFVGGTLGEKTFKFVDTNRVLCHQFSEDLQPGQVIEIHSNLGERNVYLGLAFNKLLDRWQLIHFKDEVVKIKK